MTERAKSRLSLVQSAYVVARRDFRAILFSKAFLFFLLGPVIFGVITLGAASVGQKAAENRDPPVLAVAMAGADTSAVLEARQRLDPLIGLPEMVAVDPASDPATYLDDSARNIGALLTGSLSRPRLIGTQERIERWTGEVALVAGAARGAGASYPDVTLEPTATSGASRKSARAGTATAALTLLFLLTMLLAGMVMSNLVEEKANKIIEVLAAAIPMDAVFLGKLFAMLGVSFVGIAVWGGLGGALVATGAATLQDLPTPAVGWPLFAAMFLVYFAMAYLLIGSVFLTIGAMAPTVRDVQTLSMPATILQLAVFFLATYSTTDIGSPIELGAIAFPFSSPYAMISRAAQEAALWPHALAIAWQALWVVVFVRLGARLFKRRVMKSGGQGGADKRPWWRPRARAA
ncbi:ABC transporter permease [Altererythrobacter aerius]|uniref:ABC transporter permease n=1 Tax=Tsuneonella aeria TaxID=1837929 RepID=A0A6I4TG93_9SPHN|nr:ABC transporter permease [Tsuneonella aeria]MXO75518.1 ABC transporter permease [Tsuneonella aeria]